MINLELKGVDFGATNLDEYTSEIPDNFCIRLTLSIGPKDKEGADLFQVGICTTKWLAHQLSSNGILLSRHLFFVEKFKMEDISRKLKEIIKSAERENWTRSALVLSRYFCWEYEDCAT